MEEYEGVEKRTIEHTGTNQIRKNAGKIKIKKKVPWSEVHSDSEFQKLRKLLKLSFKIVFYTTINYYFLNSSV